MATSALELPNKGNRARRVAWWILIVLCVIGGAAAIRRMTALMLPPSLVPQLGQLDAHFQSEAALTWLHVSAGLLFVALVPFQFSSKLRARRPRVHRVIGRVLVADGTIAAITAMIMVFQHPIGGMNEAAAAITFGSLFVFCILRAFWYIRFRRNIVLHREWMIRAIAIALGIATVRPIMGVFFATSRLTHLTPHDFFGTAFWIGFTINLVAGEAWLHRGRTKTIRINSRKLRQAA